MSIGVLLCSLAEELIATGVLNGRKKKGLKEKYKSLCSRNISLGADMKFASASLACLSLSSGQMLEVYHFLGIWIWIWPWNNYMKLSYAVQTINPFRSVSPTQPDASSPGAPDRVLHISFSLRTFWVQKCRGTFCNCRVRCPPATKLAWYSMPPISRNSISH